MADSFCQNSKARLNEFVTTDNDSPLIVQFAANNTNDFSDAAQLVYPYANGVDLNCGCPQRWAMKDGYGCALLSQPQLIRNLLSVIRNNLPSHFSVSVKIRILQDIKKTIELCQQLEKCGVDFVTVHGRTPMQKTGENINLDSLKKVCEVVNIPIIANGGIKSLQEADELYDVINCSGVMAASGILSNPALFSGAKQTPLECVKMWMDLKNKTEDKITFQCYHHHLVFMLEKLLTRSQRLEFNNLNSFESVDNYVTTNVLKTYNDTVEYKHEIGNFITCQFNNKITLKHSIKCRGCSKSECYCICDRYDHNTIDGKFFTSYLENCDDVDFMDTNMFDEQI